MVAFYKHDIAAWRGGTASLTHEEYRVYHVLVEQMMLEEGAILLHERMLSGLCNMSTRAFRSALDRLVRLGKIQNQDARLRNGRVHTELEAIHRNREHARLGGSSRGVRGQFGRFSGLNSPRTPDEPPANGPRTRPDEHTKPNEINVGPEPPLCVPTKPKREEVEKRREEVDKKEKPSNEGKKKGTTLPEAWSPTTIHYQAGLKSGRGRDWVDQQAEAMREWAWSNSNRAVARKADWDLTFAGWLRRESEKAPPPMNGRRVPRI
jgi:uncharacterized protein YdaU (DUF1376 family)